MSYQNYDFGKNWNKIIPYLNYEAIEQIKSNASKKSRMLVIGNVNINQMNLQVYV